MIYPREQRSTLGSSKTPSDLVKEQRSSGAPLCSLAHTRLGSNSDTGKRQSSVVYKTNLYFLSLREKRSSRVLLCSFAPLPGQGLFCCSLTCSLAPCDLKISLESVISWEGVVEHVERGTHHPSRVSPRNLVPAPPTQAGLGLWSRRTRPRTRSRPLGPIRGRDSVEKAPKPAPGAEFGPRFRRFSLLR